MVKIAVKFILLEFVFLQYFYMPKVCSALTEYSVCLFIYFNFFAKHRVALTSKLSPFKLVGQTQLYY